MNRIKNRRLVFAILTPCIVVFAAALLLVFCGMNDDVKPADVALVLGNTVQLDGQPSPRLRARLDKTIELYQRHMFGSVIVSGGMGREGFDEAAVMDKYLEAHGIPGDRIIQDNKGVTTYASAANTLLILRQRKFTDVLVISQYFHIPRVKLALRKFGVSPVYSAHASFFELRDIYSIARELIAYVQYDCRDYNAQSKN